VATALLMEPAAGVAVRELARRLGRSASTVSEVLAALRRADLIDDRHRVEGTQLFWQVADRWPATRTDLARLPMPGDNATVSEPLRLGLHDAENTAGWALTDSAAAVAYGAPLAVRTGELLDFYVPDQAILRRATTLLGAASSRSQARCAVRVAPVPAACSHRVDVAANPFEWPLAHPVFVALDLAQDAGVDERSSMPGHLWRGWRVSGKRVTFIGNAMAAVVQGVEEVRILIGHSPVVVGGLAVMCRLSHPCRATTDLDVVDRLLGGTPQLQVLRAAPGRSLWSRPQCCCLPCTAKSKSTFSRSGRSRSTSRATIRETACMPSLTHGPAIPPQR